MKLLPSLLILNCVVLHSSAGEIPVILNDPTTMSTEFSTAHEPGVVGWTFHVSSPIVVHGVGWYDDGRDGLINSHEVALWKSLLDEPLASFFPTASNLTMVTSLTIPSGTGAPLDGAWRRINLSAALTLEPGNYEIAGTFASGPGDIIKWAPRWNPDHLILDPRTQVGGPAFAFGVSELVPPDQFVLAWGAELGPMLFVEEIPEPSIASLLLLGMGMGVVLRFTRANAARDGPSPIFLRSSRKG